MVSPIRRLLDISGCIALACATLVLAGALWFEPEWLRVLFLRGLFVSVSLAVALFGVARVLEIAAALRRWHQRGLRDGPRRPAGATVPFGPPRADELKGERHIDDAA